MCSNSTKANSTQKQIVYIYLQTNTATASMVELATGIPQKSICRYKRKLELQGLLCEVSKKLCLRTGFRACYLTTNPELFPKSNQLQLF